MGKPRTIEVNDRLWEIIEHTAREDGVPEEHVVEQALRSYLGLRGIALLDDLAGRRGNEDPATDDQAMELAISEISAERAERRRARGA